MLGGPGAGKTTLLKYLALSYARQKHPERLGASQWRLPILVTLREVAIQNPKLALADYLTAACRQVGCKVTADFFDKKLQEGACILLDGLDEVPTEKERQEVAEWIKEQWNVYGGEGDHQFVLTCRLAGFKSDYAPPHFLRLEIQDFTDDDVREFVHKWYLEVERTRPRPAEEIARSAQQQADHLIAALQTKEQVRKLAVNPLMLSIIALVHRNRLKLPDRRVELYQDCVEVLLKNWDEVKGMEVSIPPDQSLAVLQPLALWMHQQKQGTDERRLVTREEIKPVILPHLASIGIEDADVFLDQIRERSGLLVEQGTHIFGFQHQTFQEYLAARQLAAEKNTHLLVEHLGEDYWQEVTLLRAGIGDASALIQGLLALEEATLAPHSRLIGQILSEAQVVDEETRHRLWVRLEHAHEPQEAVRAALWLRAKGPGTQGLISRLSSLRGGEVEATLTRGHLVLLLAEKALNAKDKGVRDAVGEILKRHLADPVPHVRYLAALGLDMLGYDPALVAEYLLVKIPAGEFTMGSARETDNPQRILSTEAFLLDRFPLTNGQYRRFVTAKGYEEPDYWSPEGWQWKEKEKVMEPAGFDDPDYNVLSAPVVGISWYEAEAYARWRSQYEQSEMPYRLPTEQEWERAARGDRDARAYPWGDEFDAQKCNTASEDWTPIIGQSSPVGSYPEGVSPHGCYDMAGNVWEWTESLYEKGEPTRVLRGGSWYAHPVNARCAFRFRNAPAHRDDSVGVRFSRTL